MRLSARSGWPREPSAWAQAVAQARARGGLVDLTASNPTAVGLLHPPEVYRALGDPAAARYRPRARGLATARAAVAGYYARRGRVVDPERVVLYASTSEAYAQLLAIVADPGDAVLVPQPGYPLLDMLGDLAGVRRVPYPLRHDGEWHVDLPGVDEALARSARARAIVVVAPSNPTGSLPSEDEWAGLAARARAHALPILVDEVFADYPLRDLPGRVRFASSTDVPCVVLSGLSKVAALPQLKLAWAVLHGPDAEVAELRARAELAADAFLSVSTPVQLALPTLLEAAEEIQPRIQARLDASLWRVWARTRGRPVEPLPADAGWTVLLRLPDVHELHDLGWGRRLLDAGVLVQPGFLFDLPAPPRVAVSLLTPEDVLEEGMTRLLRCVDAVLEEQ
jgi:alanine-synthesizing transaminase